METFNPFVENSGQASLPHDDDGEASALPLPKYAARIAVYDDMSVPPRVVVVEPKETAAYLQEIVDDVYQLMMQQGGLFPYQTIREIVENFIHAQFIEPVISILDRGATLVFSDQGPGIPNKAAAMKPSFTTATREMKRYIRGVGSGLPQVEELMRSRGGTVTIEDNLGHGTIVTISMAHERESATPAQPSAAFAPDGYPSDPRMQAAYAQPASQIPYQPSGMPYGYGYPPAGRQAAVLQQQPAYLAYQQPQMPYAQAQPPMPAPTPYPQAAFPYMQGQPQGQPAYPPQQQAAYPYPQGLQQAGGSGQPQPAAGGQAHITASHLEVLKLFSQCDRVGPSLITERLGMPAATGSRRLKDLATAGYAHKVGQQYELTDAGAQLLSTLE